MNGRVALSAAAVLLLVGTAVVALPAVDGGGAGTVQAEDTPVGTVGSSLLDVQGARIERTLELETLSVRLERANTSADRARVLAGALDRVERRVGSLETRLERLRTARDDGSVTEDTFAVRVAPLASAARTQSALLDRVAAAAETVDDATLREAGVTPDRIGDLRTRVDRVATAGRGVFETDGLDAGFYDRVATVAEEYNRGTAEENLGLLGAYLAGERINLRIVTDDGDVETVSFRMTPARKVRDLRAGPHPDATLRVTTGETTAREVVNSSSPARAASEAFLDGEVRVDGIGPWNALKWTLIGAAVELLRAIVGVIEWFSSLLP